MLPIKPNHHCVSLVVINIFDLLLSWHTLSADYLDYSEFGLPFREAAEPVEEDNTAKEMTLDEWKAARQTQGKAKTDFNVRKANEGADQKQWKGTVALQKKKKGDTDEDDEEYLEDDSVRGSFSRRFNMVVTVVCLWNKYIYRTYIHCMYIVQYQCIVLMAIGFVGLNKIC